MIFFILSFGKALQCMSQTGCVPVPYEAVALMAQLGIIELIMEIGGYKFYQKKVRKNKNNE